MMWQMNLNALQNEEKKYRDMHQHQMTYEWQVLPRGRGPLFTPIAIPISR
jgi:hypothetical protein